MFKYGNDLWVKFTLMLMFIMLINNLSAFNITHHIMTDI